MTGSKAMVLINIRTTLGKDPSSSWAVLLKI